MWETWLSTVRREMNSCVAIPGLETPAATSSATCCSVVVSAAQPLPGRRRGMRPPGRTPDRRTRAPARRASQVWALTNYVIADTQDAAAGTVAEAGAADFVVLAVNWPQVRDALRSLPAREGRIVINATNQWASRTPAFVADRLETGGSELVASLIPGPMSSRRSTICTAPMSPLTPSPRPAAGSCSTRATTGTPRSSSAPSSRGSVAPVDLGPLRMGRLMQVDGGPLSGLHAIREG
jgi:8-hydroxy-5-deazaflavin:NADPH oxidoreductase